MPAKKSDSAATLRTTPHVCKSCYTRQESTFLDVFPTGELCLISNSGPNFFVVSTSFSLSPLQSPLTYDRDARELVSPVGVAYPITASGIPNMVPACARIIPSNQAEGQEG